MKEKKEIEFYTLDRILKENAQYNMIIGERSNGKTFAVQEYMLQDFCKNGNQGAVIRRFDVDFVGKRGQQCFEHMITSDKGNLVEKYTNGKWNDITFYSMRWYLSKLNDKGLRIRDEQPFAHAFTLGGQEHDKSTSYNKVNTIFFDEFLTRQFYLPDEFILFQNVLSTIIRFRNNVKIFMCGNTVNFYSPYFTEMGLKNMKNMKQGEIQTYKFALMGREDILKVAVEFSDSKGDKPSDIYFAFNNPKLQMITKGVWEVAIYPHCPVKYKSTEVLFTYFIIWEEELLQCEIVQTGNNLFTFIHQKTTGLQSPDKDLIYSTEYNPLPNWSRKLTKPRNDIEKKIKWFFDTEKVFYQDNEIGEVVRNYLNWCKSDRGFV